MTDGDWQSNTDYSTRIVRLGTIRVGDIFEGEVALKARGDDKLRWYARLNHQQLGGYPTVDQAKAVVDHQIWNYAQAAREGLKRVKAREHIWRDAFKFPPSK